MIEKIQEVLREHLSNDELVVTADTTFESLNLDSLDTVDLVMNLEDEFEVTLEMNENVKTIGDLLAMIESAKA